MQAHNSFLILAIITLNLFLSFNCEELEKPFLQIMSPSDFHNGNGVHYDGDNLGTFLFKNESVAVVPSNVTSIYIVCNASYPITWKIDNNVWSAVHASWMINIRTRRIATEMFNLKTYNYFAVLTIYSRGSRLTGNYTCQHVIRDDLKRSVYVFFQDASQEALIGFSETIAVEYKNGRAILPCVSSKPNFTPALQKKKPDSTFETIRFNKSISFNPRIGIIFKDLQSPTGTYKCVNTNRKSTDFVIVNVVVNNATLLSMDHDTSADLFEYDSKTTTLKCCSKSTRAPMITHYFCNHPSMCDFRARSEHNTSEFESFYGKKRKIKNCAKAKLYVHSGGVIKCKGDGVNIVKQFIFGVRPYHYWKTIDHNKTPDPVPIYFNWWEIDPYKMMEIILQRNSYTSTPVEDIPTYSGQTVQVHCSISQYYFSEGIRWLLNYKNGTVQIMNNDPSPFGGYANWEYWNPTVSITATTDLKSVSCAAPVWNSTEYIVKSLDLFVNSSLAPVLTNYTGEEYYSWNVNDTDKEIRCEAMGIPLPTISWNKLDDYGWHPSMMNINHTVQFYNETNTTSEILKFHRVNYGLNGTYICVATNFGGHVSKTIYITVLETTSSKLTVAVIIGVIIGGILVSGILLLGWKWRKTTLSVENLSSAVTYKDGNVRQNAFEADGNNCTVDPSKMSKNLIEQ